MAGSFVDGFKSKLISDACGAPVPQLELAVVEYIGWFNDSRLHVLGNPPPDELEILCRPRVSIEHPPSKGETTKPASVNLVGSKRKERAFSLSAGRSRHWW
jgi:hypothetical protein